MTYRDIDPQIRCWAERHHLALFTTFAERTARFVYVSSAAGECFQISIEDPANDQIRIHAWAIDGRREDASPKDWCVSVDAFDRALEEAMETVTTWMLPSERHFPDVQRSYFQGSGTV
jgi:hypothetical protein